MKKTANGIESPYDMYCAHSFSRVWLFATPRTVAFQAPLSMGFPRQEYWSRFPVPTPGSLPDPEICPVSLVSPALAGRFFTTVSSGKPPSDMYIFRMYGVKYWVFFLWSIKQKSPGKTQYEEFPLPAPLGYRNCNGYKRQTRLRRKLMLLLNLGFFFYVSIRRAATLLESHGKGSVRKSWERVSSQMNSSCSSYCVLVGWLFLSYSDAPHAENTNNEDTLQFLLETIWWFN